MKNCDVCGAKLGLIRTFKYMDGSICKECYKKASRQFTETITQKNLAEIKVLCREYDDFDHTHDFEITGRIGNYLLVDEKNEKICILSNRVTGKQVAMPEYYDIKDIRSCEIYCTPQTSMEELETLIAQKSDLVVQSLKVRIHLYSSPKAVEIVLLSSGARVKSYALKQSYHFATRIEACLQELLQKD